MSLVGTDHRIAEQRAGHEGCIVRGTLIVNKVEGNFHVAVGRSHKSQGLFASLHFLFTGPANLVP